MTDYEPRLTEIVAETFKEVIPTGETARKVGRGIKAVGRGIKAVANGAYRFGKNLIKSTVYTGIAAYCIPTIVRDYKEKTIEEPDEILEIGGFVFGNMIGGGTFLISNGYLVYHYGPKALLIPVGTNAASYIYEKGRKTKRRLIQERRDAERERAAEMIRQRDAELIRQRDQQLVEIINKVTAECEQPEIIEHDTPAEIPNPQPKTDDNRARRIDNIIDGE